MRGSEGNCDCTRIGDDKVHYSNTLALWNEFLRRKVCGVIPFPARHEISDPPARRLLMQRATNSFWTIYRERAYFS